jgi:hypothetical protein
VIGRNPVTVPATPRSIRSARLRDVLIGALVVLIPMTAIGCKARTEATTEPSVAPSEVAASPTPTVAGNTLLDLKGTGDKTSDPFTASGESVDVTYAYTCAAPASFTISFFGTNGSPALPDVLIDDFGAKGDATVNESLNGASGPFHLEVATGCDWSIKVVGAP